MHLTAIRLAGFKSFADNTTFPVDAPLTGIIGPNGCGKSNIIDAVRWVLGETAAKQLRGQAMTDVIFAGAANRRGAAQASVALHFDNSDGKAGGAFADYAELVIARKVQSDGQSQYSINGKRVRRRDIVELLQGTGVGARSDAVIEQGMISRIIEAKPEELRVFIEEAAGIALYKTRRKESETRMNEARDHLTRHDDRLHQLGKQRDKLAQEAETAKTWRALQAQAQTASHQLQSWQYHQLHRQHEAAQEQYSRDRAALNDLFAHSGIDEAHIAALEKNLAAANAAHHAAENAALQSAARLAALRRELESGRQNQQHLAQNARDQQTRLARLSQQHHEDHEQAQQHQAEISRLQAELAERAPALEAARLAAEQARAAADQQRHQLDAQREHRHHAENHTTTICDLYLNDQEQALYKHNDRDAIMQIALQYAQYKTRKTIQSSRENIDMRHYQNGRKSYMQSVTATSIAAAHAIYRLEDGDDILPLIDQYSKEHRLRKNACRNGHDIYGHFLGLRSIAREQKQDIPFFHDPGYLTLTENHLSSITLGCHGILSYIAFTAGNADSIAVNYAFNRNNINLVITHPRVRSREIQKFAAAVQAGNKQILRILAGQQPET